MYVQNILGGYGEHMRVRIHSKGLDRRGKLVRTDIFRHL